MRYSGEQINKIVEQLLKRASVTKPPVPVERIARLLDVEIRYVSFQGDISGMVAREGKHPVIGVNTSHSTARQRFTIAHEIGHLELGHLPEGNGGDDVHIDRDFKVMLRDSNSSQATDPTEIEANAYAAALLMPRSMLIKEQELSSGFDIEDDRLIKGLAARYKVSAQAMTYRLNNIASLLMPAPTLRRPQRKRLVSRKK
ncbi:MAG: ImmA/IrrE family metallo-endopeptidase [Acidobacteriota bacterium]|nr:ImmA/IrrE family metallo-endopeptidase [Acidobacteriota bacterium]